VGTKVLVPDGHDWARKCWSARGMSWHESVGPLKGMIYSSSAYTLIFARSIETCVENDFAIKRVRSAIVGHFFYFGEDG
jgi:hypothetical protein